MSEHKTCDAPTVSLLGVGGCGVNLVREIDKSVGGLLTFANYLDSSEANQRDGEQVHIVANGHGGGKLRKTNLEEFRERIPQLGIDEIGDCDVYIVIGSLAGATGGVLLPLLTQELHKRGKKVIVGLVGETMDELGTKNTHSALKTLVRLTEKHNLYLPTVITHTDRARAEADQYMIRQMVSIITVLRAPCYEIDKTDRLNFLDASKTVGLDAGMHMIYGIPQGMDLSGIEDLTDKHLIVDSLLNLGVQSEDGRKYTTLPTEHARFSKDGLLAQSDIPVSAMIVDVSSTLNSIVEEIDKKNHLFGNKVKSRTATVRAKLSSDDGEADDFL